MAEGEVQSCPSCGARVSESADVCDLCGSPVAADSERSPQGESVAGEAPVASARPVDDETRGVFCNQCGWKNPLDARYCSRCGTELQDIDDPQAPTGPMAARPASALPAAASAAGASAVEPPGSHPSDESGDGVGRQIAVLVGAGVLLVLALFLVDIVSSQGQGDADPIEASADARDGAAAAVAPDARDVLDAVGTEPLPPQLAERVVTLEGKIAELDDEAAAVRRLELVDLYAGAGRFGRAAIEQRKVAEQQGTFDAWRRAGNLFYDWMDTVEGPPKMDIGQLTVDAYQRALAINPDDLDVRTDMATAYLNTSSPMSAVEEIQHVLDEDPQHVQANFNYGYMLLLINRLDQAEAQFVKVQEIVGPDSPYHERATELLQVVREQESAGASS